MGASPASGRSGAEPAAERSESASTSPDAVHDRPRESPCERRLARVAGGRRTSHPRSIPRPSPLTPAPANTRRVHHQGGAKLCTKLPETKRQPSTTTKKISLNGNDTAAGGSIIMPKLINTLPTTMSMTRNGR